MLAYHTGKTKEEKEEYESPGLTPQQVCGSSGGAGSHICLTVGSSCCCVHTDPFYHQVGNLLSVLCDETEIAEVELKVRVVVGDGCTHVLGARQSHEQHLRNLITLAS